MFLSFDLGIKRPLFPFSYFPLKVLTVPKDFCFPVGTDVVQFLFGFMSKYSESGSLINLNIIFNMPEADLEKKKKREHVNVFK